MALLLKPAFFKVPQEFSLAGSLVHGPASRGSAGMECALASDAVNASPAMIPTLPKTWVMMGALLFTLPMFGAAVGAFAYGWLAGLIAIPILFSSLLLAAIVKAAQEKRV